MEKTFKGTNANSSKLNYQKTIIINNVERKKKITRSVGDMLNGNGFIIHHPFCITDSRSNETSSLRRTNFSPLS